MQGPILIGNCACQLLIILLQALALVHAPNHIRDKINCPAPSYVWQSLLCTSARALHLCKLCKLTRWRRGRGLRLPVSGVHAYAYVKRLPVVVCRDGPAAAPPPAAVSHRAS